MEAGVVREDSRRTLGREAQAGREEPLEGNMAGAQEPENVSTKTQRIAESVRVLPPSSPDGYATGDTFA